MTDLEALLHHCYKHDLNYSLPLWNPVLWKVVLSMQSRGTAPLILNLGH